MPTVNEFATSTHTFLGRDNVAFTVPSGTRALVTVTRSGAVVFQAVIGTNLVYGPFAADDVLTVFCQRGSLSYVIEPEYIENAETRDINELVGGYVIASSPKFGDKTKNGGDDSAAIQLAANESAGVERDTVYGRGRPMLFTQGTYTLGDVTLSTWGGVIGAGQQGSQVLTMEHGATDGAMFTMDDDSDQQSSIGSQPIFRDIVLNGDKGDATVPEHGISLPELVGDKDDAPVMERVLVANFSGDGINIGKRHNQLRGFHLKSIANDGWGLNLEKSSDSKLVQLGVGRNISGQISFKNCASMQVTQFDVWTPGSGIFEGLYAGYFESCRNLRFVQGEAQGVFRFLGGNYDVADQTRFQITGNTIGFFNAKVSPETYSGTQYTGGGGGTAYDAIFQMRGETGTKFAHGTIGYSQGEATAEEITATPKYVWKFTVPDGGDADHVGWIEVTDVQMLHMQPVSGIRSAQVPFTQHWSNTPSRVIWRSPEPGTLVIRPTAAAAINLLRCDGSTVNEADYPLLACGLNYAKNLRDGATTITLPNASALEAVLPSGFGVYVIAY